MRKGGKGWGELMGRGREQWEGEGNGKGEGGKGNREGRGNGRAGGAFLQIKIYDYTSADRQSTHFFLVSTGYRYHCCHSSNFKCSAVIRLGNLHQCAMQLRFFTDY